MISNRAALFTIPLILVAGCTSTDSNLVDTSDIYADFQAIAEGDGSTEVIATLRIGGATSANYVDLEGGDVLRATRIHPTSGGESTETMTEHQLAGMTWYTATFPTQDEDTGFEIAFTREEGISAPESSTTIPATFSLHCEESEIESACDTFSRSSDIPFDVVWEPYEFTTGDKLSYEITGSCIKTSPGIIDWGPPNYFAALQLTKFLDDSDTPTESCLITVTITLSRTGTVDRAFGEGGQFTGMQVRTLTINSTP
jgi:hypothetical protein